MHASHCVGQAKVSTSSRGKPKGRSNAPTQGLGCCSQPANSAKESKRSILVSWTSAVVVAVIVVCGTHVPDANTTGLRRLGLLVKSQPMTVFEGAAWCINPQVRTGEVLHAI